MDQWVNQVWHMDNLDLMLHIPDYSINLIYCDVLYGTGKDFGDYKDIAAKREDIDRFYIPRIKEMYRILAKDGSIYIHMDWRISHWIRCIMDDIFGYNNFQNEIIWSYRSGGATKRRWNRKHDTILFYSKSQSFKFNCIKEKSYLSYNYGFKNIKKHYDKKRDKYYRYTYPVDVWDIPVLIGANSERVGYATQKPKELMEKIIKSSSDKGDIVADFFCGSGTTPVVAKELGRKYIACDIEEKAIHTTKARLQAIEEG